MTASTAQSELRLAVLDERDQTQKLHEEIIARVETNDNRLPDEVQKEQILMYRERANDLDGEIAGLSQAIESDRRAMEASKSIRRALAGTAEGVEVSEDGIIYRTMASYARDVILSRDSQICSKIASQFGDKVGVQAAKERLQLLKRTPADTLSSNVPGLQPAQHIAQIFQVIDSSRPLVASGQRSTLERGQLTFPKITSRPVVAVQNTQKTEGGNNGMAVDMETATASTYLGGGDLSWQAINWSTPDALDLWFRLAAASYALLTETDAGTVVTDAGALNVISTKLDGSDAYDDWVGAIMDGCAEVYANSGRMPDTLYVAPDQFYAFCALIPTTFAAAFVDGQVNVSGQSGRFAGLNLVASRGLGAGVAIVGDSSALIVAETAGAPVEFRVVEPAIGGVEVGLIGAFEAVVVEDEAFALLTTAS